MMKNILLIFCCLVSVMFVWLFTGCEDGASDSPISISPSSASLQTGQSMDFTASGGTDYSWSLKFEDTGTLSSRSGPTVRFKSTYGGTVPAIEQVLTVLAIVSSDKGEEEVSAEVKITQTGLGGNIISSSSSTAASTPTTTTSTTTTTTSSGPPMP